MTGLNKVVQTMGLLNELKPELTKLKKATDGFETVFLKNILSEMHKGQLSDDGKSDAGKSIYEDMTDQALATSLSARGALGMGKMLFKDFAPKVVAQEKQRLTNQALSGDLNVPKDKLWVLGLTEKQLKIQK